MRRPALPAALPEGAEDVTNNNRMRGALEAALAGLRVLSPDVGVRRGAVDELAKASLDESSLPLVEKAYAAETDPGLKGQLERMRATILVSSSDRTKRLAAAAELASSNQSAVASLLQERLAPDGESDAEVRVALQQALSSVRSRLAWGERLAVVFTGISLGSVLLLVALGLAITYGLMGVINMAHGELMMIGAYTTYVVQNLFRTYWPGVFDAYVLAAIPAAFLVSARSRRGARARRDPLPLRPAARDAARDLGHQPGPAAGGALDLRRAERAGREPRLALGRRRDHEQPGPAVQPDRDHRLRLHRPRRRRAADRAGRASACSSAASRRTGAWRRASASTPRAIDMLAFSFGAGIAGLGGVALSQIGNVGPDLGQSYIVDSFLVVVLGGVGQLAGTVVAGLGLGVLNKLLEGVAGAVLAKIAVLVLHRRLHPEEALGAVRDEGPERGGMSAVLPSPVAAGTIAPRRGMLLGIRGWAGVTIALAVVAVIVPIANLLVPAGSAFHLSEYAVQLVAKIMCYAMCALAMDLIWGYTGILSLGHGVFFALGGYAMGMYLMRQIGSDGQYRMPMPDFMVFLNWKEFPWHWALSDSFVAQMLLVVLAPGAARLRVRLLRLPLAHQGRLLLDHHAGDDLRDDAALLPQRDRLRRQQRLHRLQADPRRADRRRRRCGCCSSSSPAAR